MSCRSLVVGRQAAAKAHALAAGSRRYWVACRPVQSLTALPTATNSYLPQCPFTRRCRPELVDACGHLADA